MDTEPTGTKRTASCIKIFATVALISVLVGIGFSAGMATMWLANRTSAQAAPIPTATPVAQATAATTSKDQFGLLREIDAILEDEFIDPDKVDSTDMLYGAATGMVSALGDAHTMFVEPADAAIIEEDMQGSFEGIGATVDLIDGVVTIVQPLAGSPAEKAGIQAGDQIIGVDGTSIEGMSLTDAITLIRGPEGTIVTLLVQREGIDDPFSVDVTRARIEVAIVESRMINDNIGYVSLAEFNAVALTQVQAALNDLLEQNPEGIILDLRNNPGGYLHMAIEIASEFLPRGTLVVTEQQRDHDPVEYTVTRRGLATDIPLVVLVNGGSASASEIVAGALQHYERAVLVGTTTYGKGSVQATHTLSDGSSLRVTIAKWVLPGGRILDGDGLEPEYTVEITPDDSAAGLDPQLDKAIEVLADMAE